MTNERTIRLSDGWIVIVAMLIVVLARIAVLAMERDTDGNPLLVDHDLPHYATILVSADAGVSFVRDPIFAGRATLVWRAASAYMGVFRALYLISDRDFAIALDLFQLLLLAIYFPSMVVLLRRFGASLPVVLATACVSLVSSSFLVTGTRWGVLTPVVPLVMCTAVVPLIVVVAMRSVAGGGAVGAFVAGTLVAIPMLLINPATGIALIELTVLLALLAAIRRELSFKTFAVLAFTVSVWVLAARLNIRGVSSTFSFADAAEMIRYGQENVMVFPFRGAGTNAVAAVMAIHAMLTLILLAAHARAVAFRPFFRIGLIAVQAGYAAFFLHAGWLILLPLAVALDDIRRDHFDRIDGWLWCALGLSIIIGPLQQLALLAAWQRWEAGALTALVFEGARFMQFSYLILFALVARAIEAMSRSLVPSWFRWVLIAFVACGAYLNMDISPFAPRVGMVWMAAVSVLWLMRSRWLRWVGPEVDRQRAAAGLVFASFASAGVMAVLFRLDIISIRVPLAVGGCAALLLIAMGESKRDFRAFVSACVLAAVIGGPWILLVLLEPVRARSGGVLDTLGFAMKVPRAERNKPPARPECDPRVLSEDFRATADFIHARLPATSVFHVSTFDRSFRAYAGRAMLPVSDEWLIPIYDGAPVSALRQESIALWNARDDLAATRALAARFGADYLVTCGSVSGGSPLFLHGRYAIYALR